MLQTPQRCTSLPRSLNKLSKQIGQCYQAHLYMSTQAKVSLTVCCHHIRCNVLVKEVTACSTVMGPLLLHSSDTAKTDIWHSPCSNVTKDCQCSHKQLHLEIYSRLFCTVTTIPFGVILGHSRTTAGYLTT